MINHLLDLEDLDSKQWEIYNRTPGLWRMVIFQLGRGKRENQTYEREIQLLKDQLIGDLLYRSSFNGSLVKKEALLNANINTLFDQWVKEMPEQVDPIVLIKVERPYRCDRPVLYKSP